MRASQMAQRLLLSFHKREALGGGWIGHGLPKQSPSKMELGEGGDPGNPFLDPCSLLLGRLHKWNWGPLPPYRGDTEVSFKALGSSRVPVLPSGSLSDPLGMRGL